MKKSLYLIILCLLSISTNAQEWTWMKGSDTLTQPGVYGTIGISTFNRISHCGYTKHYDYL